MKNSGGKRIGAGRKHASIKTKTKQVRGVPIELFEKLKSIKDLSKLTIKFWQSLTVISDCS